MFPPPSLLPPCSKDRATWLSPPCTLPGTLHPPALSLPLLELPSVSPTLCLASPLLHAASLLPAHSPAQTRLPLSSACSMGSGGLPRGGCTPCPGRDGCCLPWAACLGWEGKELGMCAAWMARGGGTAAGWQNGELGVVEQGRSCARSCSCCPEAHGGRILPGSAAGHPQAWMKACSLLGESQKQGGFFVLLAPSCSGASPCAYAAGEGVVGMHSGALGSAPSPLSPPWARCCLLPAVGTR